MTYLDDKNMCEREDFYTELTTESYQPASTNRDFHPAVKVCTDPIINRREAFSPQGCFSSQKCKRHSLIVCSGATPTVGESRLTQTTWAKSGLCQEGWKWICLPSSRTSTAHPARDSCLMHSSALALSSQKPSDSKAVFLVTPDMVHYAEMNQLIIAPLTCLLSQQEETQATTSSTIPKHHYFITSSRADNVLHLRTCSWQYAIAVIEKFCANNTTARIPGKSGLGFHF